MPYKKGTNDYNKFLAIIKNNSGVTVNGADIIDSFVDPFTGFKFYVCMFTEPDTTDYSVELSEVALPQVFEIFLVGGGNFDSGRGGAGGEVFEKSLTLNSTYAGTNSITVGDGAFAGNGSIPFHPGKDSTFYSKKKIYTAKGSNSPSEYKNGRQCGLPFLGNYPCDSDHGVNLFNTYYWGGDGATGQNGQTNAPLGGGGGSAHVSGIYDADIIKGDKHSIHNGFDGSNTAGQGGTNTGGGAGSNYGRSTWHVHGGTGIVVLCFSELHKDIVSEINKTNSNYLYQLIKSQNDMLSQNIQYLNEMYSTDGAQTEHIDKKYQTLKTVNFSLFIVYFCFLAILLFFLFRTTRIGVFVKILIALCFGAYPFVIYYIENGIYLGITNLYAL